MLRRPKSVPSRQFILAAIFSAVDDGRLREVKFRIIIPPRKRTAADAVPIAYGAIRQLAAGDVGMRHFRSCPDEDGQD